MLFDFHWSEQLHSFFDERDRGDLREAEAVLQKWEKSDKVASFEDQASRNQLISLLRQDDESLYSALRQKAANRNTSWRFLLALEQIDLRQGSPHPELRRELEEVIKNRCDRLLIAYFKKAYTTNQASSIVCQAVSRLRDDRVALKLLEQASKAIELRGSPTNLPIAILESERLVSLATSDATFRNRAYSSCRRICELLEKDTGHLKTHPLALAKARRTLAILESDEERKVDLLELALHDLAGAKFASDSIPRRWLWEARRELKESAGLDESQQVDMLLEYRRETLRAALLLDGYSLISEKVKGQKLGESHHRLKLFSANRVETSLEALSQLQKNFNVSKVDLLRTLLSLATIQDITHSKDAQDALNKAMTIAWSLNDEPTLADSSRKLGYECQLAWIELRVKNGEIGAKPQSLLPDDPGKAIAALEADQHFKQQHELIKRLRKSQLAIKLASDSLQDVLNLLEDSRGNKGSLETVLLDSLELLVTIRTSNQSRAQMLRGDIECALETETDPQAMLFPLYALSEFEVEHSIDAGNLTLQWDKCPIPRLHKVIAELGDKGYALQSSTLNRYRMANQLHIAIAGLCFGLASDVVPDHPLQILLQKTADLIDKQGDIRQRESLAQRILRHIVQSSECEHDQIQHRAAVALAADQLKFIKSSIAKQIDHDNEELKADYQRGIEDLKRRKDKAENLHEQLEEWAKKARAVNHGETKTAFDQSQFAEFQKEYLLKKQQYESEVALINNTRDKLFVQYDELFRRKKPTSDCYQKELLENLDLVIPLIQSSASDEKSSRQFSNLLYNAQCVAIESALLLDRNLLTAVQLKLLDKSAESLPLRALDIRNKLGGLQSRNDKDKNLNNTERERNRERLFNRYQLGFELAVCWFASWHTVKADDAPLLKAMNVVAKNTNRCFIDFAKENSSNENRFESTTEGNEFDSNRTFEDLPPKFIAYFSGNESLHVFWRIGDQRIQHEVSQVNRKTLDCAIQDLLAQYRSANLVSTDSSLELSKRQLSGWLLPKKLCEALNSASSPVKKPPCIYIAPHGPIFSIPLEGLILLGVKKLESVESESQELATLGERFPLVYLPTLENLGHSRKPADMQVRRAVLSIQPDSNVGQESTDVMKLGIEANEHLTEDKDFKLADVVRRLRNPEGWEIVHFGSHGVGDQSLNASDTCDSEKSLNLDQAKFEQTSTAPVEVIDASIKLIDDEELTTSDLRKEFSPRSPLKVSHVFLSACETNAVNLNSLIAGGNTHKTLCTTFLAIGAGDVIASHWEVNVDSTHALFKDIARQYKQHSIQRPTNPTSTEDLAMMLFEARKHVRALGNDNPKGHEGHDWRRPYYWNAFTIWSKVWTSE